MKLFSKLTFVSICALVLAGCDNNKAAAKSDSKFSYISDKCQLIGAVDIEDIAKMESVQKIVKEEDQTIPYYKEIKASGLGLENLKYLYFGAEIPANADPSSVQSEGVFLLEAKSKINLPDFIALVEKNNDIKFKSETIGSKQAYIITDANNPATPPTYIIQLTDTMLAVGTKAEATITVSLFEKGGNSVLNNAALMKVANNAENKDMVWFAASVPPEVNKGNDPNSPDINDMFLAANYANDTLSIAGKAVCATEQDVQKIMMPAQILTSMAVMSSNNTVKPEDLSIKSDKNNFILNVKLSKAALQYMMEKSAEQVQQTVATETIVTEEIVPVQAPTTAPAAPTAVKTVTPAAAPSAPSAPSAPAKIN